MLALLQKMFYFKQENYLKYFQTCISTALFIWFSFFAIRFHNSMQSILIWHLQAITASTIYHLTCSIV